MSRARPLLLASPRTLHRAACLLSLTMMLSACGYKGPLYMPPPPPPEPDSSLTSPPTGTGSLAPQHSSSSS